MIPGSFDYHCPVSVDRAVALLAELGEDARVLAGGHSLIPLMKVRMAAPEHLIDLGRISELKGILEESQGGSQSASMDIVIGAMTTQHELLASALLALRLPIIAETSALIADPQIRYKGTIGGNCANGDPGNDMPALMQCLNASYEVIGPKGKRSIPARVFYNSAYDTALQTGEILTAVRIPVPATGHGYAYEKLKRKVGDYATAAAAVLITMAGDKCTSAAVALTNVGDTPLFAQEASDILFGSTLDAATVSRAVTAAEAITEPASDMRGPAEYRTKMAGVMLRRALERAKTRAAR